MKNFLINKLITMKRNIIKIFCALFFFTSEANSEEFTLRLGGGHPIGLLEYTKTASEWFAPELKKRIESKTKHKVKIQELHGGQVAKVTDVLEATRDGLLDI
jgi:TRAP-type C4-dicarboxylate transport system substrate-binding protein